MTYLLSLPEDRLVDGLGISAGEDYFPHRRPQARRRRVHVTEGPALIAVLPGWCVSLLTLTRTAGALRR
jgi:hypothetical protein